MWSDHIDLFDPVEQSKLLREVEQRIRSQQLGEAWKGIPMPLYRGYDVKCQSMNCWRVYQQGRFESEHASEALALQWIDEEKKRQREKEKRK